MATGQLQEGELDRACHTAAQAGTVLAGLRSGRAQEYLADFTARLEPHRNDPAARDFIARDFTARHDPR